MSDTTAEEKSKPREPAKKGLHGWKAALAVFGCGTLAAFGVFGVIVGVLSMFINAASSGIQDSGTQNNPLQTPGEPQASIEPGDLDLCSRNLPSSTQLSLVRVGSEENYEDVDDGEGRRVTDRCEWEVRADYSTTESWSLIYTYEAVISSPGEGRLAAATAEYDEAIAGLGEEFEWIESQGEAEFADRSYYVYGETSSGMSGYTLLAQTRSAVYEIKLEGKSDSPGLVPKIPMEKEVGKLVRVSEVEFEIWIPGVDE